MTKGQTYRLNCSVFAILSAPDGSRHPITIPEQSLVNVVGGPLNGNRLVEVEWDGRVFLAFTADLRECGSLLDTVEVGT